MSEPPANVLVLPVVQRQALMGFGAALSALKQGYKTGRKAWKPEGSYLTVEEYVEGDVIYLVSANFKSVWSIKQIDVLAQDWMIIEEQYR